MADPGSEFLECVTIETAPDPEHAVIWLHGLGADGNDFAPIVPQLSCARSRPVRFVFPHAPVRPVTVNGGMPMRAWYDIAGFEIARDQDLDGIRASMDQVQRLVDRELDRGIAPSALVLAGFSQGGAMALRLGLGQSRPLAGVLALSCYLLEGARLEEWLDSRAPQVFMGHGTHDPVVPLALGRDAAERLERAGVALEWHEYAMQHAVCPQEIAQLDDWLERRFAG